MKDIKPILQNDVFSAFTSETRPLRNTISSKGCKELKAPVKLSLTKKGSNTQLRLCSTYTFWSYDFPKTIYAIEEEKAVWV